MTAPPRAQNPLREAVLDAAQDHRPLTWPDAEALVEQLDRLTRLEEELAQLHDGLSEAQRQDCVRRTADEIPRATPKGKPRPNTPAEAASEPPLHLPVINLFIPLDLAALAAALEAARK